jgi:hypothetical protein
MSNPFQNCYARALEMRTGVPNALMVILKRAEQSARFFWF